MNLQNYLSFARSLALSAEKPILELFGTCAVHLKGDGTEVTEADRQAELRMREMIQRIYPNHDVLGEEFGGSREARHPFRWILDPIDGTAWFTLGTPLFGTLVALAIDDEPVVGVIHFPLMKETVYAAKGMGCWREGKGSAKQRLHVSRVANLSEASVSASGAQHSDITLASGGANLSAVIRRAGKFKFVGDCIQHALVCKGLLHAAIDTVMRPWDIAAIVPCVEEAGGVVSSIAGERNGIIWSSTLLTSCHQGLHDALVEVLGETNGKTYGPAAIEARGKTLRFADSTPQH
jgi:histidinol-phosphatase